MAKKKAKQAASTVVYVGPTIPGVAKQYTAYKGGLPRTLEAAMEKTPAMGGLVVPLEELPDAMDKLRRGYGHIYRLYRLVQAKR